MTYDETVANRVRQALNRHPDIGDLAEKPMFGGLTFMVRGHMCCGIVGKEIMVRVGPEGYADALAAPHARAMDFTGRPLTGMVYVGPTGFKTDNALDAWVERGLTFVHTLPVREPKRLPPKRPRT